MGKSPIGRCNACGREERKFKARIFSQDSQLDLYYCIGNLCKFKDIFFCNECLSQMNKTLFENRKCPRCEYGHLLNKKFGRYGVDYKEDTNRKGCFVATAVYGNYDHPVVLNLRYFRDDFLNKKKWGKSFIRWYYTYGPNWANIIRDSRFLRLLALIFIVKPLHLLVKLVMKNK